jgi:hypothetical protein
MFSTLRNRFGIPGVISVIALVFAMFGGAYAASNSSDGGKATASKAKQGPRGKTGKTGPAGPQGPAGPAGANGKDGSNGTNGSNGTAGGAGAPGQSVTTAAEPPLGHCGDQEGVKLHSVSGDNYVCDGEDGEDGEPWTAGGTLPPGSTETGVWSLSTTQEAAASIELVPGEKLYYAFVPISFSVPLSGPLDGSHVILVPTGETNSHCTGVGGSLTDPKAESGYLCVYENGVSGASPGLPPLLPLFSQPGAFGSGAGPAGATMLWQITADEESAGASGTGSWAVTG